MCKLVLGLTYTAGSSAMPRVDAIVFLPSSRRCFHRRLLFVSKQDYIKTIGLLNRFFFVYKIRWKEVRTWAKEDTITDFGGNPDHVTLGVVGYVTG